MSAASRTPEGGYIGAPIPRREDARLLTGRGTFVDDLEMPGVAHAAMVRSPHAHARVRRIDVALDFEMPDLAHRRSIWERVFPCAAPVGELDLAMLAGEFEVSGGVIRNAAVHAAFLAADEAGSIEMRHVLTGMQREFQKMGRLRGAKEFGSADSIVREVVDVASA